MPRTSARVVCTLRLTIVTFEPTSALVSVDLPAFGAPISAMKPQRVAGPRQPVASSDPFTPSRVSIAAAAACSAARLERPMPSAGSRSAHIDRDAEFRIVVRAGALHLAIGRRRQAAPLRPFLQHGLRIAQRPRRRAASARATAARSARPPPDSRRRRTPRRSAPRTRRRGSRCAAARRHSIPNCRAAAPRRDRSRARRRRRSRAAPGRRAGATARPRRPRKGAVEHVGDREARAHGRREIRAAGSCRRVPASAKRPRCGSARARGSPCRQTRSRSCLRARRGLVLFAFRLIERSRTTGSSARPRASARLSRRPRRRRPRRR